MAITVASGLRPPYQACDRCRGQLIYPPLRHTPPTYCPEGPSRDRPGNTGLPAVAHAWSPYQDLLHHWLCLSICQAVPLIAELRAHCIAPQAGAWEPRSARILKLGFVSPTAIPKARSASRWVPSSVAGFVSPNAAAAGYRAV